MCPLCSSNSDTRSGREHISGGYDPPSPHGIGVGGVRQHSSRAGYDGGGLRDGGDRTVDLHIPRRGRERESGEIIENNECPHYQNPPDIPMIKVGQCCVVGLDWIGYLKEVV